MKYLSVVEKIHRYGILIGNGIKDPIISERMKCYGYTREKMNQASLMHQEVEKADQQNRVKHGDHDQFKDKLKKAEKAFHKDYIVDLEFARIALAKQPILLDRIGASGRRQKAVAAYFIEAEWFYQALANDESLLKMMSVYGYTKESIQQQQKEIENIYRLMEQKIRASGEAQHSTQVRNRKLRELDCWVSEYKKVAHLAFMDSPQLLEKLGIVVKSGTGGK
ncbi:MAG: hypothetical protein KGY69_04000 [Bacteroidales bacterium]|nr:hypothetical protein [Bacteroidales bacterium]